MLLIMGMKARLKVLAEGMLWCPNEAGQRHYRHVSARRWFTLFWIPVIPLGNMGEYVECASCGAQYDPSVLRAAVSPQAHQQ